MKDQNRVAKLLGIQYPVIQASMVWLNSAELAAAVSNAGGLGVLGPNAGRKETMGDALKTAENFREEIKKTRQLTDKPFAVNYLLPIEGVLISYEYAEPIVNVILEEKVKIVITSGKNISNGRKYIEKLKKAGVIIIHREISPTVANMSLAEKMGVDAVIATGHEAGGHLSDHRISTLVLVSQIADASKIPVIAAGGIYNYRTAKAAIAAGAEGVYVGTRFITTDECPASDLAKNAIIQVKSEELIEVKTRAGDIRIIDSHKFTDIALANENGEIGSIKTAMLDGNLQKGVICVSEAAGGIKSICTAKDVVIEMSKAFN